MQEWNRYGSHTPGHLGFFGANEALAMGEAASLIRALAAQKAQMMNALKRVKVTPDVLRTLERHGASGVSYTAHLSLEDCTIIDAALKAAP